MAEGRIVEDLSGYVLRDDYLDRDSCRELLGAIAEYRKANPLQEIHRDMRGRSLHYSVIDGLAIRDHLPQIWDLYIGRVNEMVRNLVGEDVVPLASSRVGVNVNVMPPGRSEYRWHYDRCAVTAIIYLNEVEGGETEFYPRLRWLLSNQERVRTQKALDRLARSWLARSIRSKKVTVRPKPGRLVLMEGNRCWHSVRGVQGTRDRINVILAYDVEGSSFAAEEALDAYLYTMGETVEKDPNYGG